ncbi:NADP-dependent oxidoreductase [Streptomyces scabiei]|uniref:NADP-dependent oxidoreductase n=1 Tax=Streptomyces scabiei TaxID=1930 RepID=UPI0029A3797D|nr:NADP-dependent oxidoreductase [Streptomyces scabiei]MDX3524616.1 NADP-dependent oxidoreductase [Streptomyces scabiei]
MKAFVVERFSKDGLRATEIPEPQVGDSDVLIRVHAAGVNPLDSKIRDGEFKLILPHRPPFTLGHDVAGVVSRVGPAVHGFKAGDEVYARPRDSRIGTFAELIAIDQDDVALKPASLSMPEAAAVPLVALTAWQALVERANVTAGQKVLIHAGSGGVGTMAIQLARHLGATVATTTSTANVDWVKSLGADLVIDYKHEDFATILTDYDVVLDPLGGQNLAKSLTVLKPGGLAIGISGPPDPAFAQQIGAPSLLRIAMTLLSRRIRRQAKRAGVRYSFLFMRADGPQLRELTKLIESGHLHPVLDRVFPFDATLDAIAHVDQGRAKGKVVVALD